MIFSSQNFKTLFKLCTLCVLTACLWNFNGQAKPHNLTTQDAPQAESQIPVTIDQLSSNNGTIPVELQCENAVLSAPNTLKKFTCRLRNNTRKNIVAVNVTYSVILDENGVEFVEARLHTLDTRVHPDFYEASKSITPSAERIIEPPGPSAYGNATIKAVKVKVDYVEFDDKAKLGGNEKAEQIINDVREGAAKYKDWLSKKYTEHGKSLATILPLLESDQNLPTEFENSRLEQGARVYRNRLRHVYETRGVAEAVSHLETGSKPR